MAFEASSFEIESYEIAQYHYTNNWVPYIQLESPAQAHQIRNHASIIGAGPSEGSVRFPQAFEGVQVTAYLSNDHYQAIYSLLQAERPVFFHYLYEKPQGDSRGQTVRMNYFWLSTGKEPTGEGLEDRRVFSPIRTLLTSDSTPDDVKATLREGLPEGVEDRITG